ncbi:MAG: hypothetical protein ACHBNF_00255 [Chromatiales bacterium]
MSAPAVAVDAGVLLASYVHRENLVRVADGASAATGQSRRLRPVNIELRCTRQHLEIGPVFPCALTPARLSTVWNGLSCDKRALCRLLRQAMDAPLRASAWG